MSFIWIICIVADAISLLVSLVLITMRAEEVSRDNLDFGVGVLLLGFLVPIILHIFSLLFARLALETIMILFQIEKNTRGIGENTRAMRSEQQYPFHSTPTIEKNDLP